MPARIKNQSITIDKSLTTQPTPTTSEVVIYAKSDGKIYSKDGAGVETLLGGSGGVPKYARLTSTKASGTGGDALVANTWTTYPITTEETDIDGIVSLSSNQLTLGAGTYKIKVNCSFVSPAASNLTARLRLQNITDSATEFQSAQGTANSVGVASTRFGTMLRLEGQFTIASSKAFAVQYFSNTAGVTHTILTTGAVEVCATVIIEKID